MVITIVIFLEADISTTMKYFQKYLTLEPFSLGMYFGKY